MAYLLGGGEQSRQALAAKNSNGMMPSLNENEFMKAYVMNDGVPITIYPRHVGYVDGGYVTHEPKTAVAAHFDKSSIEARRLCTSGPAFIAPPIFKGQAARETMHSSGSPKPRKVSRPSAKQDDTDGKASMGLNYNATGHDDLTAPVMNGNTLHEPLKNLGSSFSIQNTESKIPKETLMALLNEQKPSNVTRASSSGSSSPLVQGKYRLSPAGKSFNSNVSGSGGRQRQFEKEEQTIGEQAFSEMRIFDNDTSTPPNGESEYGNGTHAPMFNNFQAAIGASRAPPSRADSWAPASNISPIGTRPTSGHSDGFQPGFERAQHIWSTATIAPQMSVTAMRAATDAGLVPVTLMRTDEKGGMPGGRDWSYVAGVSQHNAPPMPLAPSDELAGYSRGYSERPGFPVGAPRAPGSHACNDPSVMFVGNESFRGGNISRASSSASSRVQQGWNGFNTRSNAYSGAQYPALGAHAGPSSFALGPPRASPAFAYAPGTMLPGYGSAPVAPLLAPVGTRLCPTASEFPYNAIPSPWNSTASGYTTPSVSEPLNYRRLLDRNASADWSLICDKIIQNNDQQASIFLQQKLKLGTSTQKFEIVNAIIMQAHALMVNRFGNFLVQRCLEHGTQEQIIQIAVAIRGNTLALSMDAFGCHVIQKAFDSVPEQHKAMMVHELLRRIPETVVHRYACHVWQKLFELRWTDSPPQIMRYVNEALQGMWHEVALGETGSLVVQNIFENCMDEDKRPCIDEILASIDCVAHGQFGNWCIQHICEHGADPDRNRAIDHILRFATEYSMDQYASKVIEKCLKIGGSDFLGRYLERVCDSRPDRPRLPIIDIAGDQFGNYLVQWILANADQQLRDIVANHIRKHMVSLRGSKYGSRVAMLCTNPNLLVHPVGAALNGHGGIHGGHGGPHGGMHGGAGMSHTPGAYNGHAAFDKRRINNYNGYHTTGYNSHGYHGNGSRVNVNAYRGFN